MISDSDKIRVARAIENAFKDELPANIPPENRQEIEASYGRIGAKLAVALEEFVLSAEPVATLQSSYISDYIHGFSYDNMPLKVYGPTGMEIGTVMLKGKDIAMLMKTTDNHNLVSRGVLR